jgi:hypothetical protein
MEVDDVDPCSTQSLTVWNPSSLFLQTGTHIMLTRNYIHDKAHVSSLHCILRYSPHPHQLVDHLCQKKNEFEVKFTVHHVAT